MPTDDARDGLARAVAEYRSEIDRAQRSNIGPAIGLLAGAALANAVDEYLAALAYLAARLPTAPEVVTTEAELDAMPTGSVVLSPGETVFEKTWDDGWERFGHDIEWSCREIATDYTPARVLYRPTVDGER